MKQHIKLGAVAVLVAALLLQGCNNNDSAMHTFNVEVTNLTTNQPFSPVALVLHKSGYAGFSLGAIASDALEQLAEGGDNSNFVAEADASDKVLDSNSGSGIISPGGTESIRVQGIATQPRLSLASMLVNTNDGFVGLDGVDLGALDVDGSIMLYARVYDAGTEANTETAATIPGPAGGGEGYNATRDDRDFIAVHPGVVSADDGLTSSALNTSHRFDNPGARIVITRIQ